MHFILERAREKTEYEDPQLTHLTNLPKRKIVTDFHDSVWYIYYYDIIITA